MKCWIRYASPLVLELALMAIAAEGHAAAGEDLVIDGTLGTGNSCPDGGIPIEGGCEYGGNKLFDEVQLINGAVLAVTRFDNDDANKDDLGNLVLRSATSIYVDKRSRITAKGAGYQPRLCDDGPGPSAFPLAGGRGGCAVRDSGGGGGHFGRGGKGTKDCFLYFGAQTCEFPDEWEEACGYRDGNSCVTQSNCYDRDELPTVAGQAFWHHILDVEFGAAGGDKGCRDSWDGGLRSGAGGGRVVLFAANDSNTGSITIDGRVSADGERGCSSGNDSAGAGAGGTIYIAADQVQVGPFARISAHGGRGGDSQPKALACDDDSDCHGLQICREFADPWYESGLPYNTYRRCDPANCTPCEAGDTCAPGYTCVDFGDNFDEICIPDDRLPNSYDTCTTLGNGQCDGGEGDCLELGAGNRRCVPRNVPICDYFDYGDNTEECRGTQLSGVCDDCAGGGGGGIVNVHSRISNIDPEAIFDVRGGLGGICPICAGEAGAGAGELQIDGGYSGEVCDGRDNDFDGQIDEGIGTLDCPDSSTIDACDVATGRPNSCATVADCNGPVTDTRPRFAMVLDTSGSMLLDQAGTPTFGDGSAEYPGVAGSTSRLYTAKSALADVLAAFPESDYAMARYYQDVGESRSCQTASWFECAMSCCSYDNPTDNIAPAYPAYYPGNECVLSELYAGPGSPLSGLTSNIDIGWALAEADCINYAGSCGPPERGAQFLVDFGSPLSEYVGWLDHAETDFVDEVRCTDGDCELRATGPTPLASSLQAAAAYLEPYVQCDEAVPCREYSVILLTDGAESCQGDPEAAAADLAAGFVKDGVPIPVNTYVIGFSVSAEERTQLNAIAAAGNTTSAYFVDDRETLANALATIVSGSFVFETCDYADNDCDGLVDEDFPELGQPCDDGLLGICRGTGVYDCSADGGTECVIDTPGAAPLPSELCNGLDDNCNGLIDEGIDCTPCVSLPETCDGADNDCDGDIDEVEDLIDIGSPCGFDLGICEQGTTSCVDGALECVGMTGPQEEICNGLDDNCDGVTDGMTQACYTGEPTTLGTGVCRAGVRNCTAEEGSGIESWGACVGEITASSEVCDGLDNDCDGETDEDIPDGFGGVTGDICCPAGINCGIGQCEAGILVCSGTQVVCDGAVGPSTEICDGVDNDCNGETDDVPALGLPCVINGCEGEFQCDESTGDLVCVSTGEANLEICDGIDNDCDGLFDEEPDVSDNDDRVGQECEVPEPPNDHPPCKAGRTACVDGAIECQGAVGPTDEVCDGIDNDCDGEADTRAPCPDSDNVCLDGECYERCRSGEFPCPGGYTCEQGVCVPSPCLEVECEEGEVCEDGECVDDPEISGAGGASGTDTSGTDNSAGTTGEAGSSSGMDSSDGDAGSGTTGDSDTGDSSTSGEEPAERGGFGLATGSGGCACSFGQERRGYGLLGAFGLLLTAFVGRRRRSLRDAKEVS